MYETKNKRYVIVTNKNILCLDENGELVWSKRISHMSQPFCPTSDDGFIALSLNGREVAIVKFNSEGDMEWKAIDRNYLDRIRSIKQTADGGYIAIWRGSFKKMMPVYGPGPSGRPTGEKIVLGGRLQLSNWIGMGISFG